MSIDGLARFLFPVSERARARRRSLPIHAYVGPNGSGKSASAVWDSLPSLDVGRTVLSTVRLLDWRNPRPCDDETCTSPDHATHRAAHPAYVPLTEWHQLLDAERCDVIMDEVTGVASSRESSGMPAAVANLLVQLRRRDVVMRWTAPAWSRADKIIRETSQAVTYCRGYLAVESGDADRMWRQRRLFRWTTYDAAEFEEFTAGKREQLRPEIGQWFWGPGSDVFDAYDTMDAVATIGHVLDTGRCATCGGRRTAPACTCEDHAARRRRRPSVPDSPAALDVEGVPIG